MNKRYFQVDAPGIGAMHAEPIAALAALKLASLLFSQPIGPAMSFLPERRETTLIAPIARDPCEKCGLAPRRHSFAFARLRSGIGICSY
jgi:hypothetical protein